jgi:hypothetical protein
MNESDARQYLHMADQLKAYERGAIRLFQLIASLEVLTDMLQEPDAAWLKEFRQYWAILEDTYAVALYRRESLEDPENVTLIANGLNGLKAQLAALSMPKDL